VDQLDYAKGNLSCTHTKEHLLDQCLDSSNIISNNNISKSNKRQPTSNKENKLRIAAKTAAHSNRKSNELLAFGQYTIIMAKRPGNSNNNCSSSSSNMYAIIATATATEKKRNCRHMQQQMWQLPNGRKPRESSPAIAQQFK